MPKRVLTLPREQLRPGGRFPLQVAFDADAGGHLVDVLEITTLRGAQADLCHGLKAPFDEDRRAGLRFQDYSYTPAGHAHPKGKAAAKKCVGRVRETLEQAFVAIEGEAPARDLLIETGESKGTGYRLDPTINVVKPEAGELARDANRDGPSPLQSKSSPFRA